MTSEPEIVGRIGQHPRHPERLAFFRADGRLENTFALNDTRETLKVAFAAQGFVLRDDDMVVRG